MDETLEQACLRELKEETGLCLTHLSQFRVFDAINRDPRHRTVSVVFYGYTENPETVEGGDDAADAAWFPVSELPELAFDHGEIIEVFKKEHPEVQGGSISNSGEVSGCTEASG